MMTTIPQLRTGSCIKKLPHITKGTTYAFERMNNRARKPRIRKTLRTTNTSTYPRDYRTNQILRRNDQPSSRTSTAKMQVSASRSRVASNNRGHCSRDSDEDGQMPKRPERPETRPLETRSCLEPWSRKRPQEPRKVRDGGPERPKMRLPET